MALKKSQKSLVEWGNQKWRTKSGKPSAKTGERYLPEKDTKKGKQFSKQPKRIAKKTRKYRK